MDYQEDLIEAFAEEAAERVCRRAITSLRQVTDTTSGDDSGLINGWDEICVQVQGEESFAWESYLDIIDATLELELDQLSGPYQQALWLQTDPGREWGWKREEDEGDPDPPVDSQDTVVFLRGRVLSEAANYSNKRIRAFLGQDSAWRQELDNE